MVIIFSNMNLVYRSVKRHNMIKTFVTVTMKMRDVVEKLAYLKIVL